MICRTRSACAGVHHHAGKHRGRFSVYGTAPDDVFFVVGRRVQRIWHNDRLLGTIRTGPLGDPHRHVERRISCEADLRAWLEILES